MREKEAAGERKERAAHAGLREEVAREKKFLFFF
jgi:hypothetical protein